MRVLAAIVSCSFLASAALAAKPEVSGSIGVNGSPVALNHGRAWRNGAFMGIPSVEIMLAEKSLAGLDWWVASDDLGKGSRGVVLRFKPSNAPQDTQAQKTHNYVFTDDYQIALYAGDYGGWNETVLVTAAVEVAELSLTDGWVRGKISWKGKLQNPYDAAQNLDGYSVKFSLPLEELGPMPAQ